MKGTIFIFVGLVLLGTAVIVYFSLNAAKITVNGKVSDSDSTLMIVQWSVSGFLALLGLFFTWLGIKARIQAKKTAELHAFIIQNGKETTGTVTFVDKNYSLLINNRPIYSIVEYVFKDNLGMEYTRKINSVSSDWVIRNKIEVGGQIKVKYLPNEPAKNVMMS